jgi:hypothetical protein
MRSRLTHPFLGDYPVPPSHPEFTSHPTPTWRNNFFPTHLLMISTPHFQPQPGGTRLIYQIQVFFTVLLGSLSWLTSSYAPFNPFSEISLLDNLGLQDVSADRWACTSLSHVNFQAQAFGHWWRKEVYDSIATFHYSTGFNYTSQDVAIELGYPLVDVDRLINLIYCDAVSLFLLPFSKKD